MPPKVKECRFIVITNYSTSKNQFSPLYHSRLLTRWWCLPKRKKSAKLVENWANFIVWRKWRLIEFRTPIVSVQWKKTDRKMWGQNYVVYLTPQLSQSVTSYLIHYRHLLLWISRQLLSIFDQLGKLLPKMIVFQ